MIVRIRLQSGPRIRKATGKNRHIAAAVAALMWPGVLSAYVLGIWALGAEMKVTAAFGFSHGVLSHWQFWMLFGVTLHVAAVTLNRYGKSGDLRLPLQIFSWLSHFGQRRSL